MGPHSPCSSPPIDNNNNSQDSSKIKIMAVALITIIIKTAALCFDKKTKVIKRNGEIVNVINLAVGDDIMTSENEEESFTMVTNVTEVHGSFDAHKFIMEDGKILTVTSPHLMLVHKDGELKPMVAKEVQLHDIMRMEGGKMWKLRICKLQQKSMLRQQLVLSMLMGFLLLDCVVNCHLWKEKMLMTF